MIKYLIVSLIVLGFVLFYEINQALTMQAILEKKVKGISTQIEELEAYQTEVSNFTNDY